MVTKHGKAAHCRNDCSCFFENSCDSVSELLVSLRRVRKARLEAVHWVMRTSFELERVVYQFSVSQIPVLQLYT